MTIHSCSTQTNKRLRRTRRATMRWVSKRHWHKTRGQARSASCRIIGLEPVIVQPTIRARDGVASISRQTADGRVIQHEPQRAVRVAQRLESAQNGKLVRHAGDVASKVHDLGRGPVVGSDRVLWVDAMRKHQIGC